MLGMQPSSSKRYSEPLYYPAAGLARAAKNQRGLRFLRVVRTHLLLLFLTLVSIVTAVVLDPIRQALPVAHTLYSGNVVASESDCRRSGAASAKTFAHMFLRPVVGLRRLPSFSCYCGREAYGR